jgi:hypothetical protein
MRSYLNADILFASGGRAPDVSEPMRFEGTSGESLWWLEFDSVLARELARLMIGAPADGSSRLKTVKPVRLGKLLAPLVRRWTTAVAASVEATAPQLGYVAAASDASGPTVRGSCTMGGRTWGWRAGVASFAGVASPAVRSAPKTDRDSRSRVTVSLGPKKADEQAVLQPARGPEGILVHAAGGAASRLTELMRADIAVSAVDAKRVEAPALPEGLIRLAFTTAGQGSLVLTADREAVESLVSTTLGGALAPVRETGAVVIAAAEALLRSALRGFTQVLPGVADEPHRIVRLAEGALPSRSPHYSMLTTFSGGDRSTSLRWLVPAWMAGEERPEPDARRR